MCHLPPHPRVTCSAVCPNPWGAEEVRAYLDIQGGNLLLIGGRSQEIAHLGLEGVIYLHVNVIAGRLLLVIGVHTGRAHEGKREDPASPPPSPGSNLHLASDQPRGSGLGQPPSLLAPLPNDMVDDDGVWMLQQPGQLHGDLRETEAAATEDLEKVPELGDAFKDPEDNVRNVAQDNPERLWSC